MAYTELYVSASASGGGIGTEGDPFTIDEAIADTTVGARYNILSGNYTISSAAAITTAGTTASFRCFRGYNTTIGDLDDLGRNTDTSLDVTNFPVITLTDYLSISDRILFQNLVLEGSYAGYMMNYASTNDRFHFINCKITNSADSASAVVLRGDSRINLINCDIYTGTGSFLYALRLGNDPYLWGTRIIALGTTSSSIIRTTGLNMEGCIVSGNSNDCINIDSTVYRTILSHSTFYNCGDILQTNNGDTSEAPIIVDCFATDSDGFINNLYSGTSNLAFIEMRNRVRDVTTARVGVGNGILSGEVDTDTGGAETDYTNTGSNNLSLISTSPGIDAGLGLGTWNIGASQNEYSSTGGGGIVKVTLSGGLD